MLRADPDFAGARPVSFRYPHFEGPDVATRPYARAVPRLAFVRGRHFNVFYGGDGTRVAGRHAPGGGTDSHASCRREFRLDQFNRPAGADRGRGDVEFAAGD